MKKLFALILAMVALSATAMADVDLSNMSYDELVALKDQINLALWNSQEWQEVTVPQGVWEVGVDIPEGHWTIKATDGATSYISYGDTLDESGKEIDYSPIVYRETVKSPNAYRFAANEDLVQIDIDAKSGCYISIDFGSAVFTPYAGKPSFGFK